MNGRALRDRGIERVSENHEMWLSWARKLARNWAKAHGTVSINEVRVLVEPPEGCHPNIWGAVFRHPDFVAVGYCQAVHASAHARVVRVYKLKGNQNA